MEHTRGWRRKLVALFQTNITMAQLAIKGHATRGSEVIALLEMLGGINSHNLYGDENYAYYTIDSDKEIKGGIYVFGDEQLCHFTLEQFEEKFPYKVGDKVKQSKITDNYIGTVIRMRWDGESQIIYTVEWDDERKTKLDIIALGLQPYKEEIMKDLNLVELLRDCPTGMELDCLVFDNVTFDYVNTQQNRVYCKVDKSESVWFTPRGGVNLLPDAKCVIFPKGKTTWEGFVPPCQFKDGDILSYQHKGFKSRSIYIYMYHSRMNTTYYVALSGYSDSEFLINNEKGHALNSYNDTVRLATEEEKQKLFDAIKANGYKWNAETKTLEKLVEPKFKVGDRIQQHKARDRKDNIYTITKIDDARYHIEGCPHCYTLPIATQDHYILVPNKFDINTLKAFDKVLVRNTNTEYWRISLFGAIVHDDRRYFMCLANSGFYQCIPYEHNEHLLGTTNDCDDFYKTWEK